MPFFTVPLQNLSALKKVVLSLDLEDFRMAAKGGRMGFRHGDVEFGVTTRGG